MNHENLIKTLTESTANMIRAWIDGGSTRDEAFAYAREHSVAGPRVWAIVEAMFPV